MKDLNAKSAWADTLPSQWGPESAKIEIPLGELPPAPSAGAASTMAPAPAKLSLWDWMREGLRAALFLSPRTAAAAPSPWQVLVLSLLGGALLVGAARFQVAGPVQFNLRGWLAPMWSSLVLMWLAWWAMAPAQRAAAQEPSEGVSGPSGGLAAWYVLSAWAPLAPLLLLYALTGALAYRPDLWASDVAGMVFWVAYGVLTLWVLATMVVVSARFIRSRVRTSIFSVAMATVIGVGMWLFQDQPWEPDHQALAAASAPSGDAGPAPQEPAPLALSQAVFENQQALWERQLQALPAGRDGVVDGQNAGAARQDLDVDIVRHRDLAGVDGENTFAAAHVGTVDDHAAIEAAGSAKPEKYLPELAKLNRKGATSEHIAYDKNGDLKEISVTIYEVKNGKWEMVETMVSQAN